MAELKIYTVETRNSIVPASVFTALGEKSHIQQADVYVAAYTKTDAIQRLFTTGVNLFPNQRNVRIASGNDVEALWRAGWLRDEGQVLVKSLNGTSVVRYLGDNKYELIGIVGRGSDLFVPVPVYPSTLPRRSRITWIRADGTRSRIALRGYVGDRAQDNEWFKILKSTALSYEVQFPLGKVVEGPLDSVTEAEEAAERILGEYLDEIGLTWKDASK